MVTYDKGLPIGRAHKMRIDPYGSRVSIRKYKTDRVELYIDKDS